MSKIETIVGTVIIPNDSKLVVESTNKSKQIKLDKKKEPYNSKRISNFEKMLQEEMDKLK